MKILKTKINISMALIIVLIFAMFTPMTVEASPFMEYYSVQNDGAIQKLSATNIPNAVTEVENNGNSKGLVIHFPRGGSYTLTQNIDSNELLVCLSNGQLILPAGKEVIIKSMFMLEDASLKLEAGASAKYCSGNDPAVVPPLITGDPNFGMIYFTSGHMEIRSTTLFDTINLSPFNPKETSGRLSTNFNSIGGTGDAKISSQMTINGEAELLRTLTTTNADTITISPDSKLIVPSGSGMLLRHHSVVDNYGSLEVVSKSSIVLGFLAVGEDETTLDYLSHGPIFNNFGSFTGGLFDVKNGATLNRCTEGTLMNDIKTVFVSTKFKNKYTTENYNTPWVPYTPKTQPPTEYTITPDTGNKYTGKADLVYKIDAPASEFTSLKFGDKVLKNGTDYSISDAPNDESILTIKQSIFANVSYGSYSLLFTFEYNEATVTLTLSEEPSKAEAQKYNVTFNANKGKIKYNGKYKKTKLTKKYTYGTKYGTLPKVKRTGYKFKGWYTKKSGGKKITSKSTMNFKKNTALYARWTPNAKIANCKYTYLRKDAGTSKAIKTSLKKNTKVAILKTEIVNGKYKWYKVKVGNKTGYVYSKYVKRV